MKITSDDGTVPTQSPSPTTPPPSPSPTTQPPTTPPPSPSPTTQPTTQPPGSCNTQIPLWGKCGGNDGGPWDDKCCAPGSYCRFQSEWYSQCVEGTGPSTPSPEESPSPTPSAPTESPSPKCNGLKRKICKATTECQWDRVERECALFSCEGLRKRKCRRDDRCTWDNAEKECNSAE